MKKFTAIIVSVLMIFALTACTNNEQTNDNGSQPSGLPGTPSSPDVSSSSESLSESDISSEANNILIAYFSRAGENHNVGVIEKGNTEIVAEMIAEQTGGTPFHIQTVNPYPENYKECTDTAKEEQKNNGRPELTASVENMADYDVIFLGYPNWWGDMPMAVYTFLESYDFADKTIVPFCTHEGSGLSDTVKSISTVCSGAAVLDGLAIRGKTAQESQEDAKKAVVNWLSKIEVIK